MRANFFDWIFDSIDLILKTPEEHKKIFMREKIPKGHRTGRRGEVIFCPSCYAPTRVHHFGWSSLTCHECANDITKYEWLLDKSRR